MLARRRNPGIIYIHENNNDLMAPPPIGSPVDEFEASLEHELQEMENNKKRRLN